MTPDWLLDKLSTLPTDPNQRALFPERELAPERTRGLPMFAREWRRREVVAVAVAACRFDADPV